MIKRRSDLPPPPDDLRRGQQGSALLLAMFVLVLLAGTGVALMFLANTGMDMSEASLHTKQAFYMAEAGVEDGRETLRTVMLNNLSDELVKAAGSNGQIDFDPESLQPTFDTGGALTGLGGYTDDVPLRNQTTLNGDFYAAFLTNDPVEGVNNLVDMNEQVMITAVGSGPDNSLEMVQAIVTPQYLLPSLPPCNIMMLGPTPDFYGGEASCSSVSSDTSDEGSDEGDDGSSDDGSSDDGSSDDGSSSDGSSSDEGSDEGSDESSDSSLIAGKTFDGTDCGGSGGVSGLYVPVVCAVGADGEAATEIGMGSTCPNDYVSDSFTSGDTFADMDDPLNEPTIGAGKEIDPAWQDCPTLQNLVTEAKALADYSCSGSCSMGSSSGWSGGSAPTTTSTSITYVEGDLTVGSTVTGLGLLVVTGTLHFDTSASWDGVQLVIGEGSFLRTGSGGSGVIRGATVVANISGPDGAYGTADDCSTTTTTVASTSSDEGDDEGSDEGDDSTTITTTFGVARYHEADLQTGDTVYCTDVITPANPIATFDVTQFRQR